MEACLPETSRDFELKEAFLSWPNISAILKAGKHFKDSLATRSVCMLGQLCIDYFGFPRETICMVRIVRLSLVDMHDTL